MAKGRREKGRRLVLHTEASHRDLASIYLYNEATYGERHSDKYLDLLDALVQELADNPGLGHEVEGFHGLRMSIAKSRRSRRAYGHRIFYREVPGGIEVIRVLHTSMEWPEHLG